MTKTPTNQQHSKDGAPTASINWMRYAQYLENSSLTDQDKEIVIQSLYEIIVTLMDLGVEFKSAEDTCEQFDENRIFLPEHLLESIEDVPNIEIAITERDVLHPSVKEEA